MAGYDIIGDLHGSADKLVGLLDLLGYQVVDGAHRHPDRRAVFVGDLMDRGDDQVEVVRIVRAMHEAGSALVVLGNHEFNALAYATPDPCTPGDFARTHVGRRGAHNTRQHRSYLDQVVEGSDLHRSHLDWFRTLPFHLDLGGLRVAHACWHPASLALLEGWVAPGSPLTDAFVVEASTRGTEVFDAVEVVLKGPELHLPSELAWVDPEGTVRHAARLRWWDDSATTVREVADDPPGLPDPGRLAPPGPSRHRVGRGGRLPLPATPCPSSSATTGSSGPLPPRQSAPCASTTARSATASPSSPTGGTARPSRPPTGSSASPVHADPG